MACFIAPPVAIVPPATKALRRISYTGVNVAPVARSPHICWKTVTLTLYNGGDGLDGRILGNGDNGIGHGEKSSEERRLQRCLRVEQKPSQVR
eukprot:scaffold269408_cov33-Prasinocladus_malaysianus.AAC.2